MGSNTVRRMSFSPQAGRRSRQGDEGHLPYSQPFRLKYIYGRAIETIIMAIAMW